MTAILPKFKETVTSGILDMQTTTPHKQPVGSHSQPPALSIITSEPPASGMCTTPGIARPVGLGIEPNINSKILANECKMFIPFPEVSGT